MMKHLMVCLIVLALIGADFAAEWHHLPARSAWAFTDSLALIYAGYYFMRRD